MGLLLVCVLCNVLLAVIFKAFHQYGVNNLNAIIVNYFSCAIIASLLIGERAIPVDLADKVWFPYAIGMAVMFIVGFNLMALSFQKAGVSVTTIIQKMSLVLPASFAIIYFGEGAPFLKIVGIVIATFAIILVNWPGSESSHQFSLRNPILALPLAVFLLSGLIEIGLFYVEVTGLTTDENVQFTATSFLIAGIIGVGISLYQRVVKQISPKLKDVVAGVLLSIPNYFTIYLLLALLSMGWDGSVLFPINSIGILILTTLAGVLFYKEVMNKLTIAGLLCGAIAIFLINAEAFFVF